MITPSYGLTATERVLPRLALDWTTGLAQTGVDVTRAGVATYVTSSGLIASASADTQRIDYKTSTAGLLVEESRTNSCLWSEDFRNTADAGETRPWVYVSTASITSTTETAPDGTSTATLVDSPSESGIYQTVTVTSGAAHTQHWFIKAGTVSSFRLRDDITNISVIYNLSTGTVTSSDATSATITPLANGWYWVTATYTTSATTARVYIRPSSAGTYYQWGAQLEAGAFPTSYIPTEATAVTRNADVATMTGTNFSDWFNASEGSIYVKADCYTATPSGTRETVVLNKVSGAAGYMSLKIPRPSSATGLTIVDDAGAVSADLSGQAITANTPVSVVGTYKLNSFAFSDRGVSIATDTLGNVPTGLDRMTIGYNNSATWQNGHIQKIMFWPQRLTNAEVQAFSKG